MHKTENHVNFKSCETFFLQCPESHEFTCASVICRYSHSNTGPVEIFVNDHMQDTSNKYLIANQQKFYLADI